MRKSLSYKILLSVLALSTINYASPENVLAGVDEYRNYNVTYKEENVTGNFEYVYGNGFSFTITGKSYIENDVYGVGKEGYTENASDGDVTISGNSDVVNEVYGGYSESGEADNNTVTISGKSGGIGGGLRGGYSKSRDVYSNTVNLRDSAYVSGTVYGGESESGDAYNNHVNISCNGLIEYSNYNVVANIYGGWSISGSADNNTVDISGSAYVYGTVCGGESDSGTAFGNHVNISGSAYLEDNVYGGAVDYTSGDKTDNDCNAYKNKVYISGNAKVEGNIYGGASDVGRAYENEVYINGGTITDNVYGGYSDSSNAEYNIVTISGGIIGEANDIVNIYGGWSDSGIADNNEIIISGSADIENANLYGCNDNVTGTNNTLTIDGWEGNNIEGNELTVNSLNNFDVLEFKNIKGDIGLTANSVKGMDNATIIISSIDGTNSKITLSDNIGGLISKGSIYTTALDGWNFKDNESNGIYADYVDADAKYENNTITVTADVTKSVLTGKFIDENGAHYNSNQSANNHNLTIDNNFTTTAKTVAGAYAADGKSATGGDIYISGNNITYDGTVYAGYSESGSASSNTINVAAGTNASKMTLSGTNNTDNGNILNLEGSAAFNAINNFDAINFNNLDISKDTVLTVNSTDATDKTAININSVASGTLNFTAGDYEEDTTTTLSSVSWSQVLGNKVTTVTIADDLFDNVQLDNYYFTDNGRNGIYVNQVSLNADDSNKTDNKVDFNIKVDKSILTGKFIDKSGAVRFNSNQTENTASLTIGKGFDTNVGIVAGTYAAGSKNAENGVVNISGDNITYDGIVYAGYSESGNASKNTINVLSATNAAKMTLSGGNTGSSANTLNITGNDSTFNSIEDFETINFNGIKLNGADVLTLQSANLNGTTLNVESLEGGNNYNAGDTVTLIKSADAITGTSDGINIDNDIVTAGVARYLEVSTVLNADGKSIDMYVEDVSMNDQINLVAENRAVAAAFVNQGTDLISDSLDTISRDSNYGVKTFAAVHGNRSKYDVNSDIKINGWSTIVGVGNADKFDNGSEFSWGVFYENGSGNYRTFNEFNNEFFRGDGSLVYNGGGIAARYTNKNGVYTEGSLRAGMLKSDMDNALRDGAGNFYGYESESAYYGAHIGIGKIISLSESSDLDVYGKFFHTYTEGDSFKVANDEFEFDSINSDRLRIGARITSNKENKFSTYYGLAYEYEFNGDADMTAQGLKAPTQSLQGSSVMAEVGFNYQPTPTSPWSFDLNMRGYAGERQGGSFNVQATYTF